MQTGWHGNDLKSIIVQETILIVPPYRPEDVKKMNATPELANRVKKIVEGAQRQFREKEERERKAAAQAGPRKGG